MRIDFPAPLPQIIDQLFARLQLTARRLTAIEIAYQTNAERDVVEIIAVHMATVNLAPPAIADFDLAVAGRGSISNDEVVGQSIPHSTDLSMIIIESSCVSLTCPAVVHDDEFPSGALHRRAANGVDHTAG